MSSNPDLNGNSAPKVAASAKFSPTRTLATLAVLIFLAEITTMLLLHRVGMSNYLVYTLMDGLIMLALVSPALFILQLKPLLNQIEERKQAESALRSSETMLQRILELMPVGVWIIDKDGFVARGNEVSQAIWAGALYVGVEQYSEYKGWWVDSGRRVESEDWAAYRALTNGQTVLDDEILIEAFDGKQKVILNSAVPISDEQGTIQGVVVVNQDITQRREMEQRLLLSNELLETIFSSIDTLIAYMDRDYRFIRVNDVYARVANHPPEYFVGKNHFDLYPDEENLAIFQRVVATGEPFSVFEKPFKYAEYPERGVTHWDWSLQPVKNSRGQVEGLVLSLVDVTERIRAQSQLAQRNQELLKLSEAERRQRELAESLVKATIALNTSLDLNEVLDSILEQMRKVVPFQGALILLLEGEYLRVSNALGYEGRLGTGPAIGTTLALRDYPLLKQVCTSLQPIYFGSVSGHPVWRDFPGYEWVRSFLSVPLSIDREAIAIINLKSDVEGAFAEENVDQVLAFAGAAALALHNARLFEAESTARHFAETLSAAAQALTKSLDLDQVIDTLLEFTRRVVESDSAGVTLREDESHLVARAVRGYGSWAGRDDIPCCPIDSITDPEIQRLISAGDSFVVPDAIPDLRREDTLEFEPSWKWLIVPIKSQGRLIGLVELGQCGEARLNPELIRRTEVIVGQAAVAIQNAWLFQQVRFGNERLKSLTHKLVEIQENERHLIARELHDEAGQALSLLKLRIGQLEQDPDCLPSARQKLGELKGVADGVLEELHRLAVNLRPIALDHLGLVSALEQYANNLNSDRLAVRFKALGLDDQRLPPDVETGLYRIVQEALANIVRHSQASSVGILLERVDDVVRLFVEDDGIGINPGLAERSGRLGLAGMRERAEMLGGSLTVESHPGTGTSIIVEVPSDNENPYHR